MLATVVTSHLAQTSEEVNIGGRDRVGITFEPFSYLELAFQIGVSIQSRPFGTRFIFGVWHFGSGPKEIGYQGRVRERQHSTKLQQHVHIGKA